MAFTNQGLPSYSFAMFLAFASFGSYIFSTDPLNTARPQSNTSPVISSNDLNSVSTRLWQDPFRVIYKKNNKNKQQNIEKLVDGKLRNDINEYIEKTGNELLVLGVMVSTESIADAEERRRRNRYALIAALSEANYVPVDASHIQVGAMSKWGENKTPITLPYEWFKQESMSSVVGSSNNSKKVLLLWLDASHYNDTPYRHLEKLIETLAPKVTTNAKANDDVRKKLRIAILGPAGSGGLNTLIEKSYAARPTEKMINSLKGDIDQKKFELDALSATSQEIKKLCAMGVAGVHFLSPRATVAPNRLYAKNEYKLEKRFSLQNYRKEKSCLTFHRTIHSDDKLMASIVQELEFRDIKKAHSHVVLLSELDTTFGRALPQSFKEQFCANKNKKICDEHIHSFHYFRGIDGVAPGGTTDIGLSSLKSSTSTKKTSKEQTNDALIRRPIGAGQYDYLRRIADEIVKIDSFSRKHNGKGIRAIGILGSDVYDKLLILHALRSRLMGVTFFTTDLDAQLLHPAEFKWTRNLLVASSFNLNLNLHHQGSTPPFRDSYQTSIFYSASVALQLANNSFQNKKTQDTLIATKENKHSTLHTDAYYNYSANLPTETAPLLFEVSRNGAIALKTPNINNSYKSPQSTLHPTKKEQASNLTFVLIASLLALGLLTLKVLNEKTKITYKFYWLLSGSAVLIFISGFGAWCASSRNEEPFLMLSGISVWPTEIINSIAFILSLYFICLSIRALNDNHEKIGNEFKLTKNISPQKNNSFQNDKGWIAVIVFILTFSAFLIALLPYTISYAQIYFMQGVWIVVLLLWFSLIYKYHPIKYICKCKLISTSKKRKLLTAAKQSKLACSVNKLINNPVDCINAWEEKLENQSNLSIQDHWENYEKYASQKNRFLRTCTMVLIFQAFISIIFTLFGLEAPPLRGDFTRYADSFITVASLLGMLFILFYMADATRLCIVWIRGLTKYNYNWEDSTIKEKADELNIPELYAIHWVKLQIVAQRTEEVGKLIFYPFIIIILILFSRINYFDDWGFPQSLAIITSSLIAIALYTAIKLRQVAEKVRSDFIAQLNTDKLIVGGDKLREGKPTLTQLNELLESVTRIKIGAFQPLLEQPLVKASLLLLGGVGLSASQFTYLL